MEYQKIINLLGDMPYQVPRFVTKKWVEIYDESGGTYNVNKEIRFKTPMLRSDLCDYNHAYIVVTGKITVTNPNNNAYDKKLALKNNAPFYSCLTKINGKFIDFSDELDVVMPLYNLLHYPKSYRKISESLFNYYKDEPNSGYNNNNKDRIHYSIKDSESFNYKTSITCKLENNEDELENIKVVVPLKYLNNFWRALRIPLINCEVNLDLRWSKTRNQIAAQGDQPLVPAINNPTYAEFSITDCKLYVPVVTLSAKNENELFKQLKTGFQLNVEWNKYRCQIFLPLK